MGTVPRTARLKWGSGLGSADDTLRTALGRLIGRVIARRYRVEGLISVGGMGAVFRGRNIERDVGVAIKVLRPDLLDNREAIARFDREAAVGAKLDHPNCLTVTDIGQMRTGTRWMAMPLLHGHDLTHELVRHVALPRAFDFTRQLFRALEHAHGKGVVHRDVKPDNIFVTRAPDGTELIKLCDFGIARLVAEPKGGRFVTRFGLVLGTPAYMSPEQAQGTTSDRRADLYSAGLVFYELLSGQSPFGDHTDPAKMIQNQVSTAPRPLPATVPPILAAIVQQLLHKDRERRMQSAAEVLEALDAAERMVWPDGELRRAVQSMAVVHKPLPPDDPKRWPAERSDAQAFDDALRALLAEPTPAASDLLQDGIRPRGSVTQISGIDMDNLELVDLAPSDKD